MRVDVMSEVEIARPRSEVASYACDPDNATVWYENITSVEWRSKPPLAVGSRIALMASFLGRRLTYVYEVVEHSPGERFVMQTAQGSFPMQTTYAWQETPAGGTRMTLRNAGEPSGFSTIAAPAMSMAIRRANKKDLLILKKVLEDADH